MKKPTSPPACPFCGKLHCQFFRDPRTWAKAVECSNCGARGPLCIPDEDTALAGWSERGRLKYGDARVSKQDQKPALQFVALKKARCKTVFTHGAYREALATARQRCLKKLETGDTLIVWKLDRLGRSLRDLITTLNDLKRRGVKFRSLTEAIDTETPAGRTMWQMMGVLAELERSLISGRTRAGVQAAKTRGVKFGRKPKMTPEQIAHARKLIKAGEHSRDEIAALFTVGWKTLYRALAAA